MMTRTQVSPLVAQGLLLMFPNAALQAPAPIMTRRLCLRAPKLEDSFDIDPIYNDFDVARWINVPHPCPTGFALERFQRFLTFPPHERCFILSKKSDKKQKAIGLILANWADGDKPPIIGFFLASRFHGKGFMGEALDAALKELFQLTGAYEIRASFYDGNIASDVLLKKKGFKPVGTSMDFNRATGKTEQQTDLILPRSVFEAE
jgi:RimJ/RimL family protein N-acetyltransferase